MLVVGNRCLGYISEGYARDVFGTAVIVGEDG
jgi:hypothetical protein